jgi:formylglycine-generating enzyme required for sulfatase activity
MSTGFASRHLVFLCAALALPLRAADAPSRGAAATPPAAPSAPAAAKPPSPPKPGQPWENSLGMKFVPVPGVDVLFGVWDVRVQDYQAFADATKRPWFKPRFFAQGPTHPAVNVSWDDAKAFCAWLTAQERAAGRLTASQSYRLPQDWEWSVAVGLDEPRGGTPQDKDGKIRGVYPWGTTWPPPKSAGNYSSILKVDEFENTSPVGSFASTKFGLFDMGGNVWQWCEDLHDGKSGKRVVRGASFGNDDPYGLLSSFRESSVAGGSNVGLGFRCVVVASPPSP